MHSARALPWSRKWKCAENRRTAVRQRFLQLHILRIPAAPVETYHHMESSCRCDSRYAATNGNCSWFPNIFYTPPLFPSSRCPIPSGAFYSFRVSLGLHADNIVSFAPLVNQTISWCRSAFRCFIRVRFKRGIKYAKVNLCRVFTLLHMYVVYYTAAI